MSKTENAFVIIHFGSIIKYFELELYFCIMLQKYTKNNIIYMYSETDTPISFVNKISPFVYKTQGFNDDGITYNVSFNSVYKSFNLIRGCDFIFAYKLIEYKKICIVESDLVIMNNIDSIFNLNSPAIRYYRTNNINFNKNLIEKNNKEDILSHCMNGSNVNGGVMLITPSNELFNEYVSCLPIIVKQQCKYPNESLFEYVNNTFYNLPVIYNLSHYHTLKISKYGLNPSGEDILIYHFNETRFKHIDIIKDGWLRNSDNYLELLEGKFKIRKNPIFFFEKTIYNPNKENVKSIILSISIYDAVHEKSLVEKMGNIAMKRIKKKQKKDLIKTFSNKYLKKNILNLV